MLNFPCTEKKKKRPVHTILSYRFSLFTLNRELCFDFLPLNTVRVSESSRHTPILNWREYLLTLLPGGYPGLVRYKPNEVKTKQLSCYKSSLDALSTELRLKKSSWSDKSFSIKMSF